MIKYLPVVLLFLLFVAGFFLFITVYSPVEESADVLQASEIELAGTYVCLPLTNESEGDLSDCAVGLHALNGSYYALDLGLVLENIPQLVEGDRIEALGIITPIEELGTDYWQRYPVEGIFSVTKAFELLAPDQEVSLESSEDQLLHKPWVWQYTLHEGGERIEAPDDSFELSFQNDLTYRSSTDCNSLQGSFVSDGTSLQLAAPAATKMFCEGSIEAQYIDALTSVISYQVEKELLRLTLEDSQQMIFVENRYE